MLYMLVLYYLYRVARSGPRESNIYWSATNAPALPQNNNFERDTENLKDNRR